MIDQRSRALGSDSSCLASKIVAVLVDEMSTTGDAPLTVTVSWRDASFRSTLTVAVKPTPMLMPSRMTVPKPPSSYCTRVGARQARRGGDIVPSSLLIVVRAPLQRRTGGGDGDSREHAAAGVGDLAVQGSGRRADRLRSRRRRRRASTAPIPMHRHVSASLPPLQELVRDYLRGGANVSTSAGAPPRQVMRGCLPRYVFEECSQADSAKGPTAANVGGARGTLQKCSAAQSSATFPSNRSN